MKRFWTIFGGLLGFFLVSFLVMEGLNIQFLKNPEYLKTTNGLNAGILSFLFLCSDIVLPIPGSLVMIANGAMFGLFWGTIISLLGSLCASVIGYILGRKGKSWIKKDLFPDEKDSSARLLRKWGALAVIITRPIPLLSESVAVMAGYYGITFKKMFWASLLGLIPGCLIYSMVGISIVDNAAAGYSFFVVIGMAGLFWGIGWLGNRWQIADH